MTGLALVLHQFLYGHIIKCQLKHKDETHSWFEDCTISN